MAASYRADKDRLKLAPCRSTDEEAASRNAAKRKQDGGEHAGSAMRVLAHRFSPSLHPPFSHWSGVCVCSVFLRVCLFSRENAAPYVATCARSWLRVLLYAPMVRASMPADPATGATRRTYGFAGCVRACARQATITRTNVGYSH